MTTRRVPIMDRTGDEPKEVGWAEVDENGKVVDQDITDPDTIRKLGVGMLSSFSFPEEPENYDSGMDNQEFTSISNVLADLNKTEIPDTFKG